MSAPYMLAQAEAETRAWSGREHRFGVSFKQGHRVGFRDGVDWARSTVVSWETITPQDRADHIESCGSCVFCADHRAWGFCTSCGSDPVEALPPEGLSRCCGSVVSFGRAA